MPIPARTILAALVLALLAPAMAAAQEDVTVVYLVRHAETADDGSRDPALSATGQERAARLVRMLAGAGITAIHTTPYARTRGTAGAVAEALGLNAREYDPRDLPGFAATIRGGGGVHLVVGHSNTTPALAQLLGGDPGAPIPETEYDRVYQLTIGPAGTRTAILGYPDGLAGGVAAASAAAPPAAPEDVESVDAIVAALYDVISGPAGEPRDWDRLRSLFLPTARMIPVQRLPDGRTEVRTIAVEEYIARVGPRLEAMGFRESEVAGRVERFGDVAHVFSTYAGYREGQDEPVVRGVNTIQLVFDGNRWWVASLAWSAEGAGLPLPDRYLPGGAHSPGGRG